LALALVGDHGNRHEIDCPFMVGRGTQMTKVRLNSSCSPLTR